MTLKSFDEYVRDGVVKTNQVNISRANYLVEEAKKSYLSLNLFIKNTKIDDNTASTVVKLCHDIIHELIRAIMLKKGFSAGGSGAHEAEVSYLRAIGFKERDVLFIDQLRYSRNSATYYGKILDKEYAEKVEEFLNKIYFSLLGLANE